jgi:hypothetical protein
MACSEQNYKPYSGLSEESDEVTIKMEKHMELADLHIYTSHHTAKYLVRNIPQCLPCDTVGVIRIQNVY